MKKPNTLDLDKLTENEAFLYYAGLKLYALWKGTKLLLWLSLIANIALCIGWWYGMH